MNVYSDPDINLEVSQLRDRFSVTFDIQKLIQRNFTGTETLLVVVGFALSGIAGGLFKSAGSDVWELIKSICLKMHSKPKDEIHTTVIKIEMILPNDNRHISFTCHLNSKSRPHVIDDFIHGIVRKIQLLQKEIHSQSLNSMRLSDTKYEFIEGKWIDKRH